MKAPILILILLFSTYQGLELRNTNNFMPRMYATYQHLSQKLTIQSITYASYFAASRALLKLRAVTIEAQTNSTINEMIKDSKNASNKCQVKLEAAVSRIDGLIANKLLVCGNDLKEAFDWMHHFNYLNEKLRTVIYKRENVLQHMTVILNEINVDLGLITTKLNTILAKMSTSVCPELAEAEIKAEIASAKSQLGDCFSPPAV